MSEDAKPPVLPSSPAPFPEASALRCPRCSSAECAGPYRHYSTAGVVMNVIGVCLIPLYCAGLIFLLVSVSCLRETKYYCRTCGKWF
jgi:hypothetical protein